MNTNPLTTSPLAAAAVALIPDGAVVGLGTGRAATAFLYALAQRVSVGLRVQGVPTSLATETLARKLGIPLVSLDHIDAIDIAVDGADEVDPQHNLLKGKGGALVREKIIATAARQYVILVGEEKLVDVLGRKGMLPVEVVPFALRWCQHNLVQMGYLSSLRFAGNNELLVTDNGNHILDCHVSPLDDPWAVEESLREIPGVVGTGLFLKMNPTVLVDRGDHIETQSNHSTISNSQ